MQFYFLNFHSINRKTLMRNLLINRAGRNAHKNDAIGLSILIFILQINLPHERNSCLQHVHVKNPFVNLQLVFFMVFVFKFLFHLFFFDTHVIKKKLRRGCTDFPQNMPIHLKITLPLCNAYSKSSIEVRGFTPEYANPFVNLTPSVECLE